VVGKVILSQEWETEATFDSEDGSVTLTDIDSCIYLSPEEMQILIRAYQSFPWPSELAEQYGANQP
jgi:hypothetical protein